MPSFHVKLYFVTSCLQVRYRIPFNSFIDIYILRRQDQAVKENQMPLYIFLVPIKSNCDLITYTIHANRK